MKSKNFKKKFVLNKKTIVNLTNNQMKGVAGGEIWPTEKNCPYTVHNPGSCAYTICYSEVSYCRGAEEI